MFEEKNVSLNPVLALSKLLCVTGLHMALNGKLKQGLLILKYASNHPWKFKSWHQAYFMTLC